MPGKLARTLEDDPGRIPARLVGKAVRPQVRVQLAIDPFEQVEVERGSNAVPVIIGGDQSLDVFFQVTPDDRHAVSTDMPAQTMQERDGARFVEISDRRARKERYPSNDRDVAGNLEIACKVRDDRTCLERGKPFAYACSGLVQEFARDIDRDVVAWRGERLEQDLRLDARARSVFQQYGILAAEFETRRQVSQAESDSQAAR